LLLRPTRHAAVRVVIVAGRLETHTARRDLADRIHTVARAALVGAHCRFQNATVAFAGDVAPRVHRRGPVVQRAATVVFDLVQVIPHVVGVFHCQAVAGAGVGQHVEAVLAVPGTVGEFLF